MITELIAQKKALLDEAKTISERTFTQNEGKWQGDDEKKFDDLTTRAEAIQGNIERLVKLDAAERSLAALEQPQGRRSEPSQPRQSAGHGKATQQDADMALRGWLLRGRGTKFLTDAHRSAAQRMGLDLDSNELTIKLLGASAPNGNVPIYAGQSLRSDDFKAWETRAAMGTGSTTIGGYTVPDAPMGALERALLAFGGMRRTSTILRTDSGADLPIPTNDDTANKGARLGENTQVSEVDMTFGQLVLQAYKYSSKSVLVSVEFLQDTSIDAMGFIGDALATRIARIQNDDFTTGSGSSQPNGLVTASTSSGVTAAGQTTCTYDNILDLIHSVDPAYRENGAFMLHDSALKMIRKVKVMQYSGDTVGAPLWVPGVNGLGDTILGYPYSINQSLVTVATGTKSVLFGQLNKYIIRDSREVDLIRLNERYADYHQVGFLAFARSDGDLLDAGTHPVKYMTQA